MGTVPVYILAGQSNAFLGGFDRSIENFVRASGMAAEFVKFAMNGTPLIADAERQDWDPATGELFTGLVDTVLAAMAHVTAQGHTPVLHFLWVHGEGYHGTRPIPYQEKLIEFISSLRGAIGVPDADVTMTLIEAASTVRTAQLAAAGALDHVRTIDPVAPGYWDDHVHYDRPTREAIAATFLAAVTPPSVVDPAYVRLSPAWGVVEDAGIVRVTGYAYTDFSFAGDDRPHIVNSFSGDDVITLGAGGDRVDAGGNDDIVYGGAGDDYLNGNVHEDRLYGGAGADVVLGGHGDDQLWGDDGADALTGGRQNDRLFGGAGDDQLRGGEGDDILDGQSGADTASYSDTAAAVTVSLSLTGAQDTRGDGIDTLISMENLTGSAFADVLTGDVGINRLIGGQGADRLAALGGDDRIDAGDGADVLIGGAGRDTLTGGTGADRFQFGAGHFGGTMSATADLILDFSRGQGDRIELRPVDANSLLAGDQAFAFIGTAAFSGMAGQLRYDLLGSRALIFGDVNGDGVADFAVRLENVADVVAADFIL